MDWYVDGSVPGSMSLLRHEIVAYLTRHAGESAGIDEAELVVSEVTGNAVRHAGGPAWVTLTWREEQPLLTVRDLGPGFDETLLQRVADDPEDLDQLDESGRGLFLIHHLAPGLEAGRRPGEGMVVSATLPVKRQPARHHDPPRNTQNALPALGEATEGVGFGKEPFLRALVVQLARSVEFLHGPDAADAAVAQVGADVGGQMEAEFRQARQIVGAMSPEQIADCYVRLKHAIDGGFYVVEVSDDRIVLGNTRCPFGDVVKLAPSLCRMTSSVFGGIAARNVGAPVDVLLEERIAVGDAGCRVVVAFAPEAGLDNAVGHRYEPPRDG